MKTRINLLPPEYKGKPGIPFQIKRVAGYVGIFLVLLILIKIRISIVASRYQQQIQNINQQISLYNNKWTQIKDKVEKVRVIKDEIAKTNQQIRIAKNILKGGKRYSEIVRTISNIIPDKVWLEELNLDATKNKLILKGRAFSNQGAIEFLDRLSSLEYLSKVVLNSSTAEEVEDIKLITFEASCDVNI